MQHAVEYGKAWSDCLSHEFYPSLKHAPEGFALVDGGIGNFLEAHVATHFFQRTPFICRHPCFHFSAQRSRVVWATSHKRVKHLHAVTSSHGCLDHIKRAIHPAGDSER